MVVVVDRRRFLLLRSTACSSCELMTVQNTMRSFHVKRNYTRLDASQETKLQVENFHV